jgi:hypothetical protein
MVALTNIFLFLFALKLLWNVMIPFVMNSRLARTPGKQELSTSLSIHVEILFLFLAATTSFFADAGAFFWRPSHVLLYGVLAILFSYLLMALFGFSLGLFNRTMKPKP